MHIGLIMKFYFFFLVINASHKQVKKKEIYEWGNQKKKQNKKKNIQTQNNNRKERTNDKNINYTCTVSALNSKKIAKKNYYIIYFYIWFVESVS